MTKLTLVLVTGCVTFLAAQTPPPADYSSATAYARTFQATLHRNIEKSAEKLPAEAYGFRPSHDVRTSAEMFGHIANAEFHYCSIVAGEANPNKTNIEKEKKTKAEIVESLKSAFAYCEKAYAGVNDDKIGAKVKVGQSERNLLGLMWYNNTHTNEHYGNLVTYLRIRGIVPPSSER
jgi:uncharacterized damage-inducible protein DinB